MNPADAFARPEPPMGAAHLLSQPEPAQATASEQRSGVLAAMGSVTDSLASMRMALVALRPTQDSTPAGTAFRERMTSEKIAAARAELQQALACLHGL